MSRNFEDWIDGYLALTEQTEPSELYRLWCGLSTIAAVLQRKCYTVWEAKIYPNLYVILIGPPGIRKTTAMAPVKEMLNRVGVRMSSDAASKEALIGQLMDARGGSTIEDMVDFSCSLTILSKELSSFLDGDDTRFIAYLNDWYDCDDSWSYETKGRGLEEIEGVWVNLLGATTPATLKDIIPAEAVGAGFSSRILFVYSASKKIIPLPPPLDPKVLGALTEDLEHIHMLSGEFKRTPAYLKLYSDFYVQSETSPPAHLRSDIFEYYLNRRPTHLRKLSMLFSASMGSDMVLDRIHFDRAYATLLATEKVMGQAFVSYGKSELLEIIQRVAAFIEGHPNGVYVGEILTFFYRDIDADILKRVLVTLSKMDPKVIEIELDTSGASQRQKVRWIGDLRELHNM